jgi:hypothetical protein
VADTNRDDAGGCAAVFVGLLVLGAIFIAVAWSVSLVGNVLGLTPTYPEWNRGEAWVYEHYRNVTWGYVLTVVTVLVGVPLSAALTLELRRPRVRPKVALAVAVPLLAIVSIVIAAPVGPW